MRPWGRVVKQVLSPAAATAPPHDNLAGDAPQLSAGLQQLAANARAACDGVACVIAWRRAIDAGIVQAADQIFARAAMNSLLALVARQSEHLPAHAIVKLEPGQLAAIAKARLADDCALQGFALSSTPITTIALVPVGRRAADVAALARLVYDRAREILAMDELATSRAFWQKQASASGERLAAAQDELTAIAAERAALQGIVADCLKLPPQRRFAGLGERVARFGSFGSWLVAAVIEGELRVAAASTALTRITALGANSALAECLRRNVVTVRERDAGSAPPVEEDRIFSAFPVYVCVPLSKGAIALAASGAIAPTVLASLERLGLALGPIVERWLAEQEAARLQSLVRSLGMRMFSAIDGERARIARDLHDHLAQLLTAARLALTADPQQAREVLKQLDEALRLRVRELRPAALGRSTLREAIGFEIHRLAEAGIKARLLHPEWTKTIPRPLQELCYQVAREAISNVIRHSGATRAEISTERRGGRIFLRIDDNGRGIAARKALTLKVDGNVGMGLAGMSERLKLMGGALRLERLGGVTRLTAEVPER